MPDAFTTHFIRNDHQTISKSQCSTYYSTVYTHVSSVQKYSGKTSLHFHTIQLVLSKGLTIEMTSFGHELFSYFQAQAGTGMGAPAAPGKRATTCEKLQVVLIHFLVLSESIGSKPKGLKWSILTNVHPFSTFTILDTALCQSMASLSHMIFFHPETAHGTTHLCM